jgi:hypothetical protein
MDSTTRIIVIIIIIANIVVLVIVIVVVGDGEQSRTFLVQFTNVENGSLSEMNEIYAQVFFSFRFSMKNRHVSQEQKWSDCYRLLTYGDHGKEASAHLAEILPSCLAGTGQGGLVQKVKFLESSAARNTGIVDPLAA